MEQSQIRPCDSRVQGQISTACTTQPVENQGFYFGSEECQILDQPNVTNDIDVSQSFEPYTPQNLKLSLTFPEQLTTLQFSGDLKIEFTVQVAVTLIVLQADVSGISEISVVNGSQSNNFYENHVYNTSENQIYIYLREKLQPDIFYYLSMKFDSELRTDYTGFYIVPYLNERKETEYLMSSKFKPNHGKKAFPFWNKAGIWTVFYLNVIHHQDFAPIFNSKKKTVGRVNSTMLETTFTETYIMPIYQFSLFLVKFTSLETAGTIEYRVYGSDSCSDQFTLRISNILRPRMGSFVQSALPGKYDILKIPTDAKVTNDDNWAAAVYAEKDIEVDDSDTSVIEQVEIALRIGRAFAHNYFGGHLCIASWSELWLNDGFANWLSYRILEQVHPDWEIGQFFMVFEYQRALLADSDSPIPILIPTTNTNLEYVEEGDLNRIFSAKSSSFIRMLENYSGKEKFQKIIQNYISTKRIVTSTYFLEKFVDEVGSGVQMTSLQTWLSLGGCPLLTLTRNYSNGALRVVRSSFPENGNADEWWLPFNAIAARNADFTSTQTKYTLGPHTSELFISSDEINSNAKDWILLNVQAAGYYRTNYDLENWKLLTDSLVDHHNMFHVNNRAQLIDDAFRLSEGNVLPFGVPLSMSLYLTNEQEFAPWTTAQNMLHAIELLLDDRESWDLFNFYVQKLTQPIYAQNNLAESTNDPVILKATRGIISYWACKTWNPSCFCKAKQIYQDFLKKNIKISPNIRTAVLCTGISVASRQDLELTFEKFFRSNNKVQRFKLIYLLGCSKNEDFLADWLRRMFQAAPLADDYKPEWTQAIPNIVDKGAHCVLAAINTLKISNHQDLLVKEAALLPSLNSIAEFLRLPNHKELFFSLLDELLKKDFISKEDFDALEKQVEKNLNGANKNRVEILDWLRDLKKSSGNDFISYSYERQPSCDSITVPRSCGCGCACENNSKVPYPFKHLIWLILSIMFLASKFSFDMI